MQVKLTLGTFQQPRDFGSALEVECASCGAFLDLHQPDMGRPERLLGTCEACGDWYLILPHDDRDTTLLRLPEEAEIVRGPESPAIPIIAVRNSKP